MTKQEIRKTMLAVRRSLSFQEVTDAGKRTAERLFAMEEWQGAKTVMLYMDYRKEMPTKDILTGVETREIVLPYTNEDFVVEAYAIPRKTVLEVIRFEETGGGDIPDGFRISPLGILEPDRRVCRAADLSAIDLVVVPGVAFDLSGNRIGFGKGCYDRFLPQLRPDVKKIAIAYDFQVLEEPIPADPTDFRMDAVVTPTRTIRF